MCAAVVHYPVADAICSLEQALQSERAGLKAQLAAAHPATAQRLRSEVDTLQARLGQLSAAKARIQHPVLCQLIVNARDLVMDIPSAEHCISTILCEALLAARDATGAFPPPQDELAVQLAERQRLEADLATARADHAAELRDERQRLATAERAAQAADDRALQATAERERLSGELTEARDAVKV